MLHTPISLTSQQEKMEPHFALVFHGNRENSTEITLHKINDSVIQIGDYVSGQVAKDMIFEATTSATGYESEQLMPQNLLLDNTQNLIWYTKAQRKVLHVRHGNNNSHQMVNYPALLFIAHKDARRVRVFALGTSARPTLNSKLYHAPFFNLDGSGNLCLGTASLPSAISMKTLSGVESAFFDANGTHTNHKKTLSRACLKKHGSLFSYWKHKAKTQDQIRAHEMNAYAMMSEVLDENL